MRMNIPYIGLDVLIQEGTVSSISIESQKVYRTVVEDLWNQKAGKEGEIVLSEKDSVINIQNNAVCIFNALDIDANDRRIISKLYKELNENSQNQLFSHLDLILLTFRIVRKYISVVEATQFMVLACGNPIRLIENVEDTLNKKVRTYSS